ncbi:MAG: GIY-YIG nuclease family protein [bacterium]|nr:GIY-YIG nuclease family protein [bacterium]
MFYVYILKSKKDGLLYTGSTNDLRKRFTLHNSGNVFSTKNRRPFELIYYESYKSEKDARIREHNLKMRANALGQLKRRIKDSLII